MSKVYLSLGSNKGDRLENFMISLEIINKLKETKVINKSSFYLTEPYRVKNQTDFINQVILIETSLKPGELHYELIEIEKKLGRNEKGNFKPREIDIDILFYDDLILKTESLSIPHYDLHNRRFVLEPLCEISPDFIHPELKLTAKTLLHNLSDNLKVTKLI